MPTYLSLWIGGKGVRLKHSIGVLEKARLYEDEKSWQKMHVGAAFHDPFQRLEERSPPVGDMLTFRGRSDMLVSASHEPGM